MSWWCLRWVRSGNGGLSGLVTAFVMANTSTTTKPTERLVLSASEIGTLLGVPESTVRNLHRFHKLKGGFRVGRALRWAHADVVEYVEKQAAQAKKNRA